MTAPSAAAPVGRPGGRARRARLAILGAALLLVAAVVLALAIGPTGIGLSALPRSIAAAIGGSADPAVAREALVLLDIRLPRAVVGVLVGAALAVSGAVLQGLFRNPLADPGLLGAAPGAALAAAATIAYSDDLLAPAAAVLGRAAVPVAAFLGALAATLILYALSTRGGRTTVTTLLLAGVAIGAFANAATGWIVFTADDRELRDITF